MPGNRQYIERDGRRGDFNAIAFADAHVGALDAWVDRWVDRSAGGVGRVRAAAPI